MSRPSSNVRREGRGWNIGKAMALNTARQSDAYISVSSQSQYWFRYTGLPKVRPPKEIPLKCRITVRKIIPSNQKSSVLYLWKISLNFIRYSPRNHELIKRWLLRRAVNRGWPPLFYCFARIEHWQINQDSDDLTQIFRPYEFMVCQTKFHKYIMRLSVWNSNKITILLFAHATITWWPNQKDGRISSMRLYWLVACWASSHFLSHWWLSVNWTTENKFQWYFGDMSSAKWRPVCIGPNVVIIFSCILNFKLPWP